MKKTLLVVTLSILSFSSALAQAITVTSLNSNPAEVNSDFTVNIEYTTTNSNDIIYIGLELKNSDGSWAATIAEAFVNPVGASGTDVATSAVVTVPSGVTPSIDLTGGQYYELKVELNAEAWAGWLAGDYPAMTLAAEGTLSVDSNQISKLKVYPNPAFNSLNILGIIKENSDVKINNLQGQTVYSTKNLKNSSIDISQLASGIYLLSIKESNKNRYIKFVKK